MYRRNKKFNNSDRNSITYYFKCFRKNCRGTAIVVIQHNSVISKTEKSHETVCASIQGTINQIQSFTDDQLIRYCEKPSDNGRHRRSKTETG